MTKWKEQRKDEREREEEIQNTPFIHVLGEGREQNHRGNNRPPLFVEATTVSCCRTGIERRVSCSFETTWKSHSRQDGRVIFRERLGSKMITGRNIFSMKGFRLCKLKLR